MPLGAAWFLTALVVGPIGFLLFALSEGSGDRLLGLVLAAAAVLAGLTGAAVLASGEAARPWSLGLSAGLVLLGVVAAGVALTGTPSSVADALLLGLPPIAGGVLTALLARRR
jgi:4-amino-4-deoxy-L-arabinose transferase-like glycosyltransferase